MAVAAVNMDVFDSGLDTFADPGDMSGSAIAMAPPSPFSTTQMKEPHVIISPSVAYNSGLFFPDVYEYPDYIPELTHLSSPQSALKQVDDTFPSLVMSDLDADLHNKDPRITADYGHPEAMGPQRRHTDGMLSTAQTRRKAQNRAAQRAFRERKERHVRELESRLSSLTEKATSLQCDNDRLVNLLKKVQSESQSMHRPSKKSRAASFSELNVPTALLEAPTPVQSILEPRVPSVTSTLQSSTEPSTPSSATSLMSLSTPKCLDPAAAWDLLVSHPLFADGALDVAQVCSRLSSLARCEDTMGPVFDEVDVRRVIEEVAHTSGVRSA